MKSAASCLDVWSSVTKGCNSLEMHANINSEIPLIASLLPSILPLGSKDRPLQIGGDLLNMGIRVALSIVLARGDLAAFILSEVVPPLTRRSQR